MHAFHCMSIITCLGYLQQHWNAFKFAQHGGRTRSCLSFHFKSPSFWVRRLACKSVSLAVSKQLSGLWNWDNEGLHVIGRQCVGWVWDEDKRQAEVTNCNPETLHFLEKVASLIYSVLVCFIASKYSGWASIVIALKLSSYGLYFHPCSHVVRFSAFKYSSKASINSALKL